MCSSRISTSTHLPSLDPIPICVVADGQKETFSCLIIISAAARAQSTTALSSAAEMSISQQAETARMLNTALEMLL